MSRRRCTACAASSGQVFIYLWLLWPHALSLRVQIVVISAWANVRLRQHLRRAFRSCKPHVAVEHSVEQLFFMGDPAGSRVGAGAAEREARAFGDMVLLGGPDHEEPVPPNLEAHLHVPREPAARAHRLAHSLAWLLLHRAEFEYVVQLPDDSVVHLPRLLQVVSQHAGPSLVLGAFVEAPSSVADSEPGVQGESCPQDPEHERHCLELVRIAAGGLDFRGCLRAAQRCCPGGGTECGDLGRCLRAAQQLGLPANLYYGVTASPRWLSSAGWILGRLPAEFIGTNAAELKQRGHPGLLVVFWLSALEGVHFIELPAGAIQRLAPANASTGSVAGRVSVSTACPSSLVLAPDMDEDAVAHPRGGRLGWNAPSWCIHRR